MKYRFSPIPELTKEQELRFWSGVKIGSPDECWPWTKSRGPQGYGAIGIGGKVYRTTRIAVALKLGRDPGPLVIMHSCNNPPCCNPAHLTPGTQRENNQWRFDRPWLRGERHGRSQLFERDIHEIRILRRHGVRLRIVAKCFGVSESQISRIEREESWDHLKTPEFLPIVD